MISPNSQLPLLSKLLDVARLRNEVIAHNVANVNTPGHRSLEVQFENTLSSALGDGNASQVLQAQPKVTPGGGGTPRADGNDVDIDREMGRLQKNAALFELYTQLLATQLSQYRSAINGQ